MLRFETAGESHGECLVATINGLPAGIPISLDTVNRELWRRQQGYGRGGRMKIESDRAEIVAGVRHSHTIGSPVAILIRNLDWQNWTAALPVEDIDGGEDKRKPVTRPRPGHADLAGAIKYNFHDARYIIGFAADKPAAGHTNYAVAANSIASFRYINNAAEIRDFRRKRNVFPCRISAGERISKEIRDLCGRRSAQ